MSHSNMNRCIFSGRLTANPVSGVSKNGSMPYMNFSLAVNQSAWNAQDHNYQDIVSFIDCVMFSELAEEYKDVLKKGDLIAIESQLRVSPRKIKGTDLFYNFSTYVVTNVDVLNIAKPEKWVAKRWDTRN